MSQFTFADLMDLLNSDATSAALAERVKGSFKEYYETQTEKLPDVCEGGRKCREEIKSAAMIAIKAEWEATLDMIRSEIQTTLELSRTELETSYKSAYYCKHGCQCQYIESRYAEIKASIQMIESRILERE